VARLAVVGVLPAAVVHVVPHWALDVDGVAHLQVSGREGRSTVCLVDLVKAGHGEQYCAGGSCCAVAQCTCPSQGPCLPSPRHVQHVQQRQRSVPDSQAVSAVSQQCCPSPPPRVCQAAGSSCHPGGIWGARWHGTP
jgi:hypothetical protein